MAGPSRVSTNSEIDRLLDSDSDDDSVMTELDFAQMEFDQTNSDNEFQDIVGLDNEEVEDFANLGGGDGNASRPRPRQMANSDMIWETMNTYNGMRESFLCDSGPKMETNSILDTFLFFFDQTLIDLIVNETNKYAEQE
ncbi:hypothetical protein J6590_107789, partial [Homalodisca vitripennis]